MITFLINKNIVKIPKKYLSVKKDSYLNLIENNVDLCEKNKKGHIIINNIALDSFHLLLDCYKKKFNYKSYIFNKCGPKMKFYGLDDKMVIHQRNNDLKNNINTIVEKIYQSIKNEDIIKHIENINHNIILTTNDTFFAMLNPKNDNNLYDYQIIIKSNKIKKSIKNKILIKDVLKNASINLEIVSIQSNLDDCKIDKEKYNIHIKNNSLEFFSWDEIIKVLSPDKISLENGKKILFNVRGKRYYYEFKKIYYNNETKIEKVIKKKSKVYLNDTPKYFLKMMEIYEKGFTKMTFFKDYFENKHFILNYLGDRGFNLLSTFWNYFGDKYYSDILYLSKVKKKINESGFNIKSFDQFLIKHDATLSGSFLLKSILDKKWKTSIDIFSESLAVDKNFQNFCGDNLENITFCGYKFEMNKTKIPFLKISYDGINLNISDLESIHRKICYYEHTLTKYVKDKPVIKEYLERGYKLLITKKYLKIKEYDIINFITEEDIEKKDIESELVLKKMKDFGR